MEQLQKMQIKRWLIGILGPCLSVLKRMEECYFVERIRENLGRCGEDVEICPPADIRGAKYLFIGNNVFIGPRVLIGAGE